MGEYTTVAQVENLLQIDIKSNTKPSIAQVEDTIREVEASITARRLGSHSSDVLIKFDVTNDNTLVKNTAAWQHALGLKTYAGQSHKLRYGRAVVPPHTPIISVVSGTLSRNKAALHQTEDWEVLSEGPGDSTDFIILKKRGYNNVYHGYALLFYSSKTPSHGYQRLRATYLYGYDVPADILQRWATLAVAREVIRSRLFSGQPMNISTYTGGSMNTYVNTEYELQIQDIEREMEAIEKQHFPSKPIGLAVM